MKPRGLERAGEGWRVVESGGGGEGREGRERGSTGGLESGGGGDRERGEGEWWWRRERGERGEREGREWWWRRESMGRQTYL
jgi:hypothetical protein